MDIHILVSVLLVICQGPLQTVSAGGALPLPAALGTALGTAARTAADRASGAPWRSRRSKRCSCSSLMDKECVYFCHLDIIWVNTPEQTVPYGLGNTRTRRALQDKRHFGLKKRCQCTSEKDKKCFTFCQMEAELRAQSALQKGGNPVDKDEECLVPGLKCVHSRNMKRFETIDNAIKTSFRIAKIKASLKEMKTMKHNRTNKKQSIWERLKTTP